MALDRVAQPFYDNSIKEYHDKNYRQVLFTSGRAVQCRELTGIGNFATEHIKEVAGLMFKEGTILNGCNVRSVDRTPRTDYIEALSGLTVGLLYMNGGRIFIDGMPFTIEFNKFPNFSKDAVPIKLTGQEIIYVEVLDTVITAIEDNTLLDPASGYDNFEAPGAHRLQRIARYISSAHKDFNTPGNIRIPVVELLDGKVVYEAASKAVQNESSNKVSSNTDILDVLSQRTFETSGNYLVNGYRIKEASCPDNTKIGVEVSPGIAYINGRRIELQSSFIGYIDKILVTSTVQGEEHPVEYLKKIDSSGNLVDDIDDKGRKKIKKRYKLNLSPAAAVSEVSVPIIGKRQLVYNQASIAYLTGLGGSVNKILKCYVPTSPEPGEGDPESLPATYEEFTEGVDFRFENQGILWLSSGKNPTTIGGGAAGNQYWVTFLYKPNLVATDYHIEFSSKKEATLRFELSNGIVKIPNTFINPTIKSVKNPHVPVGNDFAELSKNKQWYQSGNELHVATKTNPTIPILVQRRSNTNSDNIGVTGAVIRGLKYYSEQGVISYKIDNTFEAKPDYRFYSDSGNIEWLGTTKPPVGEVYVVEAELGAGVYVDYGAKNEEVIVNFTYENQSELYSNDCHDSYLVIHDNIKVNRSTTGGDNLTISYEAARSRTTSVGLDKDGNIAFYHGTVIDQYNNLSPIIPTDSLVIADAFIKPTTATEYRILSQNNYRMRMTDLRDMFDRVKDIEYNISLNDLEKEAESKLPGQVLRGVFTDAFMNVSKSDNGLIWSFIKDSSNQAIPLITEGKLSPNYKRYSVGLKVNESKTTAGLFDNIYMLSKDYRQEVWLKQPFGTSIRSAAEGLDLMECFPSFNIDPDNDQFIENNAGLTDPDPNADKIPGGIPQSNTVTKNCYLLTGDSASLISSGNLDLPNTKNKAVTIQFWMFLQGDKGMPFSFKGLGTPTLGANLLFSNGYFGVNTYNSDIAGIKSEEFKNQWKMVTCIFKCKADNPEEVVLYINGDKQQVTTFNWNNGKYNPNNMVFGDQIRIGGSFFNNTGFEFKGKIADIRLWNRALSDDEIKASVAKEFQGNEEGLIGWWKDKIEDNKIIDSITSGTKHDLIVTPNGGFANNPNGTIECETSSFAEIISGASIPSNTANIKNVIDLTAGTVKDEQEELVLDPTRPPITRRGSRDYITKNVNAGIQASAANVGGRSFDYYQKKRTWYEKVVTHEQEVLGEFVKDISSVTHLRRRVIVVKGQGFLADTDLIGITFDGVPVQLHKLIDYNEATDGKPSTTTTENTSRYWKTNNKGEFKCGFIIPEGIQIGVREVKLTAPGDISLKAMYWGAGLKASKLKLTRTNEIIKWEPRTQITGGEYKSKDGWTLLEGWTCSSRCGTTPLCQTFYVNDSSLTKPVIKDIGVNSDVFVTSADVFFRTAGECPDCIAGFVELTDSGVPKSDSGAGPSRFVGGVKVFDSKTINMTVGDPSRGTAAHNIRWENLVPLKGGKGYGFIVGSTDGNTTLWIASIENSSKNIDAATGTSIISEPDRGILLSSPNGQTWATFHYEDLKYTFYIADFFADNKLKDAPASMKPSKALSSKGKVSYIEYDEVDIRAKSSDNLSAMNFFIYEVNAQNSTDGSGYINYEYSVQDPNSNKWLDWKGFEPGSVVFLDKSASKVKIRASLYSFSKYSSPIISKDAFITCGQYILPTTYTSVTGAVGKWNIAEVYIDKFMDENLSEVELYVSPDQGYTWKHLDKPLDVTPIIQSYDVYNGERINQYHYHWDLKIEAPVIEDIVVKADGNPGDFPDVGEYEFGIALVDSQGNESPLSNLVKKKITTINANLDFKVKFNPNATGFRIYARLMSQPKLFLFYDSTASAILREDLPNSTTTSEVLIGKEGAAFPHTGIILIDNEYIKYNSIEKLLDSANNPYFKLAGTEFTRKYTHNGRESILGAHKKGTVVELVTEGFLQQDSPTACVSGIWRFPQYSFDRDFIWRFNYLAKDLLKFRNDLQAVNPRYNEDLPANYTSENVTFRIEMRDKEGKTTVETMDRVPNAGRVMITSGYEAY